MKVKNLSLKFAGHLVFIAYLIALMYFMFFSDFYGRTHISTEYRYNLQPFKEIMRFIKYHNSIGTNRVLLNLGGNVVGFLPFGFMIPLLYKKARKWYIVLLLSLEFSVIIEVLQLITKVGSCDVDDVILNTLGGVLGFCCYLAMNRIRRKKKHG